MLNCVSLKITLPIQKPSPLTDLTPNDYEVMVNDLIYLKCLDGGRYT